MYTITEQGRRRFHTLLHEVVRTYEVAHSGVEVGMIFLPYLGLDEAICLLEERREAVLARRGMVEREADSAAHLHERLARDHMLSMMDAELAWVARTLDRLYQHGREDGTALATSILNYSI